MTFLFINNKHCRTLTQLRDYFCLTLNSKDNIYWDLLDNGRDHIISEWLREHEESELAMRLENIDSDLSDSEYLAEMAAIILDKERKEIPCKPDFSECFSLESLNDEDNAYGRWISLRFKVLQAVNNNYEVKIQTSWGTKAIYINPYNMAEGDYITETFYFRKRPKSSFYCIGIFTDNKKLETEKVSREYNDAFVDIGLSVKWAKCNLGAKSPEEYGDYYAWGEVTPKDEFTPFNSKNWEVVAPCIVGNYLYDAATAALGEGVRLPTSDEFEEFELFEAKCSSEWTTQNGIQGKLVTGPNGNSVFFPAAGERYSSSLASAGYYGYYWNPEPGDKDEMSWESDNQQGGAFCISYNDTLKEIFCKSRYCGCSVRPVQETPAYNKSTIPSLYINNEHCKTLTQLRGYFNLTLTPQDDIYRDLLDNGRNHIISAWLREHRKNELAMHLENIAYNLNDSEYFAKMDSIILDKDKIDVPYKPNFSSFFSIESFDYEDNDHGKQIRLIIVRALDGLCNEDYEVKIQTSWGTKAIIINPDGVIHQGDITVNFNFRKRLGLSFDCAGVFVDNEKQEIELVPRDNDNDFVDLGLSVKWAKCNLGAKSPEEYGDYYAWGEIEPKKKFSLKNGKTLGKGMSCIDGNSQYDAATAALGEGVRLPTREEIKELIDVCCGRWTTQNGVQGILVIAPNGNTIFLPAAGHCHRASYHKVGMYGNYWSATSLENDGYSAYKLYFDQQCGLDLSYKGRHLGYSIRPIQEK